MRGHEQGNEGNHGHAGPARSAPGFAANLGFDLRPRGRTGIRRAACRHGAGGYRSRAEGEPSGRGRSSGSGLGASSRVQNSEKRVSAAASTRFPLFWTLPSPFPTRVASQADRPVPRPVSFPIPLRGSSGFAPDSLWPTAAVALAGVSHRSIFMKR